MTRSADDGRGVFIREDTLDFPAKYLVALVKASITCRFYISAGKAASPVPAILFCLYAFGRPGRISYALSSPATRIRNAEDEVVVVFTTRTWIVLLGTSLVLQSRRSTAIPREFLQDTGFVVEAHSQVLFFGVVFCSRT
jgi:hypothetical protein